MEKGISVEVALNSHKTFYAKMAQGNGYFPIDKYVWREDVQGYEHFVNKSCGWVSRGIEQTEVASNNRLLKYRFEHNGHILSFDEMTNTRAYNLE